MLEDIDRIQRLYGLDTINVLQEPHTLVQDEFLVAHATVEVPTLALSELSKLNQMHTRDANTVQVVDIYHLHDGFDHIILAYLYRGGSEALNQIADAIVLSLSSTCQ